MGKDYYILRASILTLFIIFGCVSEQDDKEVKSIVPQRNLNTQKAAVADIFLNNLFHAAEPLLMPFSNPSSVKTRVVIASSPDLIASF